MTGKDQAQQDAYTALDDAIQAHQSRPDATLEVLHCAQRHFGWLSPPVLRYIANALQLAPSKVVGVATFYSFFSFDPPSKHECLVCMGTACYVGGAADMLHALESEMQVKAGDATEDGSWHLRTAHCLGDCGHAPLVVLDRQPLGRPTPEFVLNQVRSMRSS